MTRSLMALFLVSCAFVSSAATEIKVPVFLTDNNKTPIGYVAFEETRYGLLVTPNLSKLPPGIHGFHLHEQANCGNHAKEAHGHFDPHNTKTHQGPYKEGHLGDLPVLFVDIDGKASLPVLAPRLTMNDLSHVALMIHEGGDTYSDTPELGGGGARIACGEIR